MRVGDYFRSLLNSKLQKLINDIDVVRRINIQLAVICAPDSTVSCMSSSNIQKLRWLNHVLRVVENTLSRCVFNASITEVGEEDDLISVERTKSR